MKIKIPEKLIHDVKAHRSLHNMRSEKAAKLSEDLSIVELEMELAARKFNMLIRSAIPETTKKPFTINFDTMEVTIEETPPLKFMLGGD